MGDIIAKFDPNATTTGTFTPSNLSNGIGKIVIWNESNWILDLVFVDGSTDIAPAWTAMIYELAGPLGKITWTQDTQLLLASSPISKCIVVSYTDDETIPGVFPLALVRQASIGNQVSTTSASAAGSVANDNNPLTPSNVFIEATPAGVASSTVSIATDGTMTIKGDVANVLTTLLQLIPSAAAGASSVKLSDATRQTEVLGTLLTDGASTFTGDATFNGAGLSVECTNNLDVGGTAVIDGASTLDNGGANTITTDGSGNLTVGGTLGVTGISTFTGDATFNGAGTGLTVTNNELVSGKLIVTGEIDPNKPSTTVAGSVGGNAIFTTAIWGSGIKLLTVFLNGWNSASVATYTFPSGITSGFFFGSVGNAATMTWGLFIGVNAQTIRQMTGFGAGGAVGSDSAQSAVHSDNIGSFDLTGGAATSIQIGTTGGAAITGSILVIGI